MEDLKDVSEAVWNLISLVYQLSWNLLHADNSLNSLRQKVMSKFTLKVKPIINSNNANKNKIVPTSIKKLLSLIFTKLPKKVKEISKFFKNLKSGPINKPPTKWYTQASKPANHIEEVIKIKDVFLSLRVSKID